MISELYFWQNIIILAIGTLAIRGSIIAVSKKVQITPRHREMFTFIPAAILPALIAPMVFFHEGHVQWLLGKERFAVLILSTAVCVYTRHMLLTVCFGLVTLYLLTQL